MSASVPSPIPASGPIAITGPLSIPELLDRTFRALRARFGILVLSAAIIMVPIGALTVFFFGRFLTGYFELLEVSFMDPTTTDVVPEEFIGEMAGYFGEIMLIAILYALGSTLVTLISMHHIQRFLHGESSTVGEGWRVAIRRLLPMIGMQLAEGFVIALVSVVVLVAVGIIIFIAALIFGGAMAALNNETAGIFLGIGLILVLLIGYVLLIILMLAPTLIFLGRWIAAAPSLMIEGLRPIQALQRSWELTKGRMWRGILYVALLFLFSFVVISLPLGMAQWIAMVTMPGQIALISILSTVGSYLLNLFYQPFYATATVLYYYDLRVRAEAYDLSLRVAALEAEVAPMLYLSKRIFCLVLWLALLCFVATPLRAQTPINPPPPLTLDEYRAELEAAIAELEAAPADEAEAAIEPLQERFAAITRVEFPNDELVAVTSILDDLDASEDGEFSQSEIALARLRGALAQIDASAADDTAARLAILAEVLARPEFNSPLSWWERFWQWLRNLLADLLPEAQPGANAGWLSVLVQAVPWLITILVVAAVLWLLSYWLQRVLATFVSDARIAELVGDDDLPTTAAEARRQASVAAQSGLYRDAVRRIYLAALLQLAEHDLIHYERSLTNREVLIRVPDDSPIRPHLEPVVATFDQVWYGVREPDQATFNAYEQEIDTLAAVAERAAADPARRGGV